MAEVIKNENIWEQVLWFLDKKDKHIDNLREYFWGIKNDGSVILGLTYYLEQAILKNTHIDELEIPLKRNENQTDYHIINLKKENDSIVWYYDNELKSKEELISLLKDKDIIAFENNLLALIEKMHLERNKTIEEFSRSQNLLKAELNTGISKCHGI